MLEALGFEGFGDLGFEVLGREFRARGAAPFWRRRPRPAREGSDSSGTRGFRVDAG